MYLKEVLASISRLVAPCKMLPVVLSCLLWSTVLRCSARMPIHFLDYWTVLSVAPGSWLAVYFSVSFPIVNPLQIVVCKLSPQGGGWIIVVGLVRLSGRTSSALAWHTKGRVFASQWLQQVLRFVTRISAVQYVEFRVYCPV